MKIAVRYYTKTGNTQKLAQAIADAAGVQALSVSVPLSEKTDILFLGSSVYAAGVAQEIRQFIRDNRLQIGCVYSFSTAALLASTYPQIKKLCAQADIPLSEKEFHCRGAFSVMHKNRPNEEDLKNAAAFAQSIINE